MINVIGQGYIGLPTALMFAKNGIKVVGTDYNKELIKSLQNGKLTFQEEGLDKIFREAIEYGIEFSTEYKKLIPILYLFQLLILRKVKSLILLT